MIDWLLGQTPGSLRNRQPCPTHGYYCKDGGRCVYRMKPSEEASLIETLKRSPRLVHRGRLVPKG